MTTDKSLINNYVNVNLQIAGALAKALEKAGQKETAKRIISESSKMADIMLDVSGVREDYQRPIVCPTCHRKAVGWREGEYTEEYGMCEMCHDIYMDGVHEAMTNKESLPF